MRLKACRPLPLTLLLVLTSAAPWLCAQGNPTPASSAGIYTCIDDQGRKITADRPIASCTAKEQRVLNKDGSLKMMFPPILSSSVARLDDRHADSVVALLPDNRAGSAHPLSSSAA